MSDEQQNPILNEMVYTLARIMEIQDVTLFDHAVSTALLSLQFGKILQLSETDMLNLRYGSLLHDIGMLALPEFISFKAETLTQDEWMIIHQHPDFGVSMLSQLSFLSGILPIVQDHQEHWDGTGYPNGKIGEEIHYLARICTITNSFDALTSQKIYRPSHSRNEALELMQFNSGKVYDPDLLIIFNEMITADNLSSMSLDELFGIEIKQSPLF